MSPRGHLPIYKRPWGQMGTKERTRHLQLKITELLKHIGWSQNYFAGVVFFERNEYEDAQEEKRFTEKFKKQLVRETTEPGLLEEYLKILRVQSDYDKIRNVQTENVSLGVLGRETEEEVRHIGDQLTERIKGRFEQDDES